MSRLKRALDAAASGAGQVVLLTGIAGIGKSRLAFELSEVAQRAAAGVLWGRCWEGEGAPPFWPWIQVVRACGPRDEATPGGGPRPEEDRLERLLGGSTATAKSGRKSIYVEAERFRLFDAFLQRLTDASRERPHVVILDDLHYADSGSLTALRFIAPLLLQSTILLVATFREEELEHTARLAVTVSALSQLPHCDRIRLGQLSRADVQRYVQARLSEPVDDPVAEAVHRRTEGHPLFFVELVESMASGASSGAVPRSIRAIIESKIGALSAPCRGVMQMAAAVGREFETELLARALACSQPSLQSLLREAARVRLVEACGDGHLAWRFVHALMRDALYESTPAPERCTIHAALAAILEGDLATDEGRRVAALAHHYAAAVAAGSSAKAVDYAHRAGQHALAVLAYEEAETHFRHALQWLERATEADLERFELLLLLGEAIRCRGDLAAAREIFRAAAALARTRKDPELLARAGVAMNEETTPGYEDHEVVGCLEDALAALPRRDSALRASALINLASALGGFTSWNERCDELAGEALAIAKRVGEPQVELFALNTAWEYQKDPAARLAISDRMIAMAQTMGDMESLAYGQWNRRSDLLVLGRIAEAQGAHESLARLAERLRLPRFRYYVLLGSAMQATVEGRFAAAQPLITDAWELGRTAAAGQVADDFAWNQFFVLYRNQGRLAELEGPVREAVRRYPTYFSSRAALVLLLSEIGRPREAEALLHELVPDASFAPPENAFRVSGLVVLSVACSRIGDRERARILHDLLLPQAGLNVVVGHNVVCLGAVDSYLGLLAGTMQRWDDAEQRFEAAIAFNSRLSSPPLLALTQLDYAKLELARGGAAHTEHAQHLLQEASQVFAQLEMRVAAEEAQSLQVTVRARLAGGAPLESGEEAHPAPSNWIRFRGGMCTISFGGTLSHLKDRKGLRYVAELLERPGLDIHCAELVAAANQLPGAEVGDAGEIVDRRALAEYRQRLIDLEADLVEAERLGDLGGERIRSEQAAIRHAVAAAIGRDGRLRRAASSSERARVNVKNCINGALSAIREFDERLWSHLHNSLHTGTYCRYTPERDTHWQHR